jgi:hypothetical protein
VGLFSSNETRTACTLVICLVSLYPPENKRQANCLQKKVLEWQLGATSAWQNSTTTSSLFRAIEDMTNKKFLHGAVLKHLIATTKQFNEFSNFFFGQNSLFAP